jgi:hypothetical protein
MKISKNHATGHLLVGWLPLVVPEKPAQIIENKNSICEKKVFVKKKTSEINLFLSLLRQLFDPQIINQKIKQIINQIINQIIKTSYS